MASKDGPPARGKSSVQFSIHEDGSEIVEGSSAVDTTISVCLRVVARRYVADMHVPVC